MKKTLISTSIAVILSFSGAALSADVTEDWEKELNKVSKDFSNLDVKMSDISTLLKDSGASEEIAVKTVVAKPIVTKDDKVSDLKNNALPVLEIVKINEAIKAEENVKVTAVEKEEEIVEAIEEVVIKKTVRREIMSDETDYVFLRNIPEGTRLKVNQSYTVLPKKKFIIFSDGVRVMKTPQSVENPETQFCFMELINSGSARILKKGKSFVVTGNKTEVKEYSLNKSYGDYVLRTYQTVFSIDNKSVKNFTCYSSETYQKNVDSIPRPLTLKNLKDSTGGVFKVSFPAYEEI